MTHRWSLCMIYLERIFSIFVYVEIGSPTKSQQTLGDGGSSAVGELQLSCIERLVWRTGVVSPAGEFDPDGSRVLAVDEVRSRVSPVITILNDGPRKQQDKNTNMVWPIHSEDSPLWIRAWWPSPRRGLVLHSRSVSAFLNRLTKGRPKLLLRLVCHAAFLAPISEKSALHLRTLHTVQRNLQIRSFWFIGKVAWVPSEWNEWKLLVKNK